LQIEFIFEETGLSDSFLLALCARVPSCPGGAMDRCDERLPDRGFKLIQVANSLTLESSAVKRITTHSRIDNCLWRIFL
jgi:hypothetical protein